MSDSEQTQHQANQTMSYSDHDSFFHNAPIGAFRTTLQGTYVFTNPTLARMYGYESPRHMMDEVTDIGGQLYVDRRDREEFLRLLQDQGCVENYESRQVRRDGTIFWSSRNAWIVHDEDGNVYYQGFNTDITKRKRAEEDLEESERRFRRIIEDISNIAVQGYDEERRVIFWNKASEYLYGYSKKEAIGKKIDDLIVPPELQYERKRLHQRWIDFGEKIFAKELELRDKNSNKVPVFSSHAMHETIKGKEIFSLDIDLRPIREAEKVAAAHEKYALVGQIAGKIAHDFNNILAGISGNTELTLLDCEEPDTRESLKLILELTERGKNLTRNLVVFAKNQEPKNEYFQIKDKVDLVLGLLRKDLEGIRILRDDSEVPDILADPGMIEHALVNLMQNAIHATSMNEHPRITLRTYSTDHVVCIDIEDNGCGIPEDQVEKIFDPSFTLKGSKDITGSYSPGIMGTGYGMANVKRCIEKHNGQIDIKSEVGQGTQVKICFPIIKKELSIDEVCEIKEKNHYSGKYILIVEDEKAIYDVHQRILASDPCNHKVDIATNGQTAIEFYNKNLYDIIILDSILPGKISGMDVYHYIREKDPNIPILFVSGNLEFLESVENIKQSDPNIEHISKPCPNMVYIEEISKLLEKQNC